MGIAIPNISEPIDHATYYHDILAVMEDIMQPNLKPSPPAQTSVLITALGKRNLRSADIARIKLLIPTTKLDIHEEIERQHEVVKSMQSRILDDEGKLHEDASAKEISTVITGFTSFLNLYLRSMEKIDRDKQSQEIENAVLEAIQDMPKDIQDQYFVKLKARLKI